MEALKARIRELEKQILRGDRYKCLICMVSKTLYEECLASVYSSIHPSFIAYSWSGWGMNWSMRDTQTFPSLATLQFPLQGDGEWPIQRGYIILPSSSRSAPGLLPVGHPGSIQIRSLNNLSWLLSVQRISGSNPSFPWMMELLTLSPGRVHPKWRKHISASCIQDLVHCALRFCPWTVKTVLVTGLLPIL